MAATMVDLEISSDNMVTLPANNAQTGSRAHVAPVIAPFPYIPSIAFMFGVNRFLRTDVAARVGG